MGGDLKYGAEHEPAVSPADFIGRLQPCGSVCDADHGSAVAHPDVGDLATAATELSAPAIGVSIGSVSFLGGFDVAFSIDVPAFLREASLREASLREPAASTFAQIPFIDVSCRVPIRQEAV